MQPTTNVNLLLDIDELEGPAPLSSGIRPQSINYPRYEGINQQGPDPSDKFANHIRNNRRIPDLAGMGAYNSNDTPSPMMIGQGPGNANKMNMYGEPIQNDHNPVSQFAGVTSNPTCVDCAAHAANCPVCKSYFNNDHTLYIITICILSLICILLLKKVLNV